MFVYGSSFRSLALFSLGTSLTFALVAGCTASQNGADGGDAGGGSGGGAGGGEGACVGVEPLSEEGTTGGAESGGGETTTGETGSDETGSDETGTGDTGTGETGTDESGTGETGIGETGTDETGTGDTGTGDMGTDESGREEETGTGDTDETDGEETDGEETDGEETDGEETDGEETDGESEVISADEMGALAPQWRRFDFQPMSCGYEQSYGLNSFEGHVTVVAMWQGWCGFCQSQALKMEQIRLELANDGMDVQFIGINGSGSADNDDDRENLYQRCSFPLFQDVSDGVEPTVYNQHDASKDDIFIYDRNGILARPMKKSGDLSINLATSDGYDNVKNAIIEVYEAQ